MVGGHFRMQFFATFKRYRCPELEFFLKKVFCNNRFVPLFKKVNFFIFFRVDEDNLDSRISCDDFFVFFSGNFLQCSNNYGSAFIHIKHSALLNS